MKYFLTTLTAIMAFAMLTVAMPDLAYAGSLKLNVCHLPPGNLDNYHTIRISEKALSAHLSHGDLTDECDANCAALCDDQNACTIDDDGGCETAGCPAPVPVNCDDGDFCTVNSCDSVDGCESTPVDCGSDATCDSDAERCVPNNCIATAYGGNDYLICQGQRNLSDSETFCSDEGMGLAYMNTLAENSAISAEAVAAFGYTNFEETSYWIANTKNDSPIFPWHAGEPNGDGIYIHMGRYGDFPEQWNDVPDSYTWGWICETSD